jgi:hypothetical protein
MKIMSADDCLLFREKVRNKQIVGAVRVNGNPVGCAPGTLVLIGASHG